MFYRKRQVNLRSGACECIEPCHHQCTCETGLMSQVILKYVVFRDFIFKNSACAWDQFCTRTKTYMALYHIIHVNFKLLIKRKLHHVARWVTSGSYEGHMRVISGLLCGQWIKSGSTALFRLKSIMLLKFPILLSRNSF